jgi:hypothetical protein
MEMRILVVNWETVEKLMNRAKLEFPESEVALWLFKSGLDLFDIDCDLRDAEVRELIGK